MNPNAIVELSGSELVSSAVEGAISCEQIANAFLEQYDHKEPEIKAWVCVDQAVVRAQAQALDRLGPEGLPLFGLPVGIKDIIYTEDFPTEHGSPLYRGCETRIDAACVAVLKAQGAIILGKTTTVEFASLGQVPATCNPINTTHTPGGSSGGSAAAVAANMSSVALGTQTGGSTIRPASYCGVIGYKPTFGRISLEGVRAYAPSLDTLGIFSRTIGDLRLVNRALGVPSEKMQKAPSRLRVGVYHTPHKAAAEPDSQRALADASRKLADLGVRVEMIHELPEVTRLTEAQDTLMHGEGRASFLAEYLRFGGEVHPEIQAEVNNQKQISNADMRWAYDYVARARIAVEQAMEGYDAWLTYAVPGEAPVGLERTGDAIFNRLWTALHVPCITVPAVESLAGLPVGVQIVASRFADHCVLGVAELLTSDV